MTKNLTAAHLPVAAAPTVPSWHAFGTRAAVVLAGAAHCTDGFTRGTGITGVTTLVGDKRNQSRMVDPAPSSPPV